MEASSIDKLSAALVKAQGLIEGAIKGKKNDHFRSKYADLGAVWDACRDALQASGLAVVQLPTEAPAGHIGLRTIVLHESGQSVSDTFFMPLKDPTNPQAAGSALTYARRYALSAAIGICPEDDDGNAAAAPNKKPSDGGKVVGVSVEGLRARFSAADADEKKRIFTKVRNSSMPEPEKMAVLAEFRADINGVNGK